VFPLLFLFKSLFPHPNTLEERREWEQGKCGNHNPHSHQCSRQRIEHSISELEAHSKPSVSTPLFTDVQRVCETHPRLLGFVRAKNLDILLLHT
jgi:hypothetical protein